ncbi:MAG: hypothetical protein ABIG67_06890, partial [Pseudomonadota bacterium]
MSFESILKRYFPVFNTEADFIDRTYRILNGSGFDADNTIACVDVCRDEISQPLVTLIKEKWGEAFNLSSLAGMFFAGKTGLKAAMHHAPVVSGKERYVYFALPHIAISARGELGICKRRGRKAESHACGALHGFLNELSGGRLNLLRDNGDMEFHLLKMRLMREIPYGHVP